MFNYSYDNVNTSIGEVTWSPETARIGVIGAAFLATWIVLGNLFLAIVILGNKSLRKRSHIFLLNLCIADLCVGALVMPWCFTGWLTWGARIERM